jgi:hypothetical protein
MSVIESKTFTNIYEGVWAILEGKNTMAAMYPPDGFAILAAWNRKQIAATPGVLTRAPGGVGP